MKNILALLLLFTLRSVAATYYVDPDNGDNGNNGLGPDASHGTNKPWATFAYALANAASGDTVYLSPGVYRGTVQLSATWTSEVLFSGDPLNAQGFKNGSGVLKPAGYVRITGFATNDTTAGTAASLIDVNGKDYFTLEKVMLHPYRTQRAYDCRTAGSNNLTLRQCYMQSSYYCVSGSLTFGQVLSISIDRCILYSTGGSSSNPVSIIHTSGTGSDWDPDITVTSSVLISNGYNCVGYLKSGASANVAGGMTVTGCTLIGSTAVDVGNSSTGGTLPWTLRNNYIIASSRAYDGQNTAQVDSDYNLVQYLNTNNNANFGANDHVTDWTPAIGFGALRMWGLGTGKPMFVPWADSPLLQSGEGNNLSTDMLGKARPSTNSRGALEYHAPQVFTE